MKHISQHSKRKKKENWLACVDTLCSHVVVNAFYFILRVMLTRAFRTLVKDIKTNNFYIENNVFYIFKRLITQILRLFYHI
jgi:ABC-type phosphate transport system permease subunit